MSTLPGFNARKVMLIGMLTTGLLATLGGIAPSQAYTVTNYTNAVLDGCYSHLATSVDTATGTNKTTVGTRCFDGLGNIVDTVGPINQSGGCTNLNGHVNCSTAVAIGTYSLAPTNVPGQGMGTMTEVNFPCTNIHDFVVNSVDPVSGVAHGYQFALEKIIGPPACKKGPNVVGGTAWLQQP